MSTSSLKLIVIILYVYACSQIYKYTTSFDVDKQTEKQDITCELLTIKGHFKISGSSPSIQAIIGSNQINGEGKAKVKLEKLKMSFTCLSYPVKKDDGEVYIVSSRENFQYKYDIGKATFITEKVFIGKDDISQLVTNYLNNNWKTVIKSFGKGFMDKAMDLYFSLNQNFFNGVPTNKYIIEDLSPYAKN